MFYSATPLDRLDQLRKDSSAVDALWNTPTTRIVPLWRCQVLVAVSPKSQSEPQRLVTLTTSEVSKSATNRTLLGKQDDVAWFSVDYSTHDEDHIQELIEGAKFVDLRVAGPNLADDEAAILAFARALSFWQQNSAFCSVCGNDTKLGNAGHVRICQAESCGRESFPRTDPAVIMLVIDKSGPVEKCLLGRSAAWPDGVYSTLAGFVEPGESLEAAVAREVKEESDIDVIDVQYLASQPWPFPRSIMLGFKATAISTKVTIEPTELADAQWFTREQLLEFGVWGEESDRQKLPRPDSIARFLVDSWLYEKPDQNSPEESSNDL